MRLNWSCIASVAVALLSLQRASADGMRCGQRLISNGDTLYTVRSVCGEPDAADRRTVTRTERRRVRGPCFKDQSGQLRCERELEVTVDLVIDEWTYDFGPRRFVHYLTFENSKLVRVVTGGYGTKESLD